MEITYAGTVAPGEDVRPVLAALDHVHEIARGSFRLRVLGPPDPWRDASLTDQRPWLELDGVVSSSRAREAMAQSSALLLLQWHPAYFGVLPGKAFEYIGTRRPILALVPAASEMEMLINDHADARVLHPHECADLEPAVMRLLDQHRRGTLQQPRVPESSTAPLWRREQARQLAEIFAGLGR
jgi:hypothetical protein